MGQHSEAFIAGGKQWRPGNPSKSCTDCFYEVAGLFKCIIFLSFCLQPSHLKSLDELLYAHGIVKVLVHADAAAAADSIASMADEMPSGQGELVNCVG